MTRLIGVEYGDESFHIVGRELRDVFAEIDRAEVAGGSWMSVLADGGRQAATILISPHVPILLEALPDF